MNRLVITGTQGEQPISNCYQVRIAANLRFFSAAGCGRRKNRLEFLIERCDLLLKSSGVTADQCDPFVASFGIHAPQLFRRKSSGESFEGHRALHRPIRETRHTGRITANALLNLIVRLSSAGEVASQLGRCRNRITDHRALYAYLSRSGLSGWLLLAQSLADCAVLYLNCRVASYGLKRAQQFGLALGSFNQRFNVEPAFWRARDTYLLAHVRARRTEQLEHFNFRRGSG